MDFNSKQRFFAISMIVLVLIGSLGVQKSVGSDHSRASDPDLTVEDIWINHTTSKIGCRVVNIGLPYQGLFTLNLTINGYLNFQEIVDWTPGQGVANVTFPQSYNWRTPKVTVEVEIYYHVIAVDGNFSNNKRVERWEQNLPDLIVKAFFRDPVKGNAAAIIENIGDIEARGFFYVDLSLDGISEPWEMVWDPLPPGNTTRVDFYWIWNRNILPTANISLKVDFTNDIPEKNEDNNYHNVTWKARSPLFFTLDPRVQGIGKNNATIICETSVPTSINVNYGKTSKMGKTMETRLLSTFHSIELTGLDPDTGINYNLELSSVGWSISKKGFFSTGKAQGGTGFSDLSIIGELIFNSTRDLRLPLRASSDSKIKKLDLYFNDKLVKSFAGVDTKSMENFMIRRNDPFYKLCMNYKEALAEIRIVATDGSGDTASTETMMAFGEHVSQRYPRVDLTPLPGIHSGNVALSARCMDPKGITDATWSVDGVVIRRQVPILSDTTFFFSSTDWNSLDFPDGTRTIRIAVNNTDGNTTTIGTYVFIDNFLYTGDADVRVGRQNILRTGTVVTVPFEVGNLGTEAARNIVIIDLLKGYVPIDPTNSSKRYSSDGKLWEARIDIPWLDPGETMTVSYRCIPAQLSEENEHKIGYALNLPYDDPSTERVTTICTYERGDGEVEYVWARNIPALMFIGDGHPDTGGENAIGYASYMMLTNPYRLEDLIGEYNTDRLLLRAAELASLKNGVMGMIVEGSRGPWHTPEMVRTSILDWAAEMNPIFSMAGYLAILGENDIIPAWHYDDVVRFSDVGWVDVKLSDHGYSSLDSDEIPELVVGRIIGDGYSEMLTQIQTSIDEDRGALVNDHGGSALLMAGAGGGVQSFMEYLEDLETGLAGRMSTVDRADKNSVLRTDLLDITFLDNHDLVASGDIDGDGMDEIVALDHYGDRIEILEPTTGGLDHFYCSLVSGDRLLVGDVMWDASGKDEIIVLKRYTWDEGYARVYDENGDFQYDIDLNWLEGEAICMADDDGDGLDDFIIASWDLDAIGVFDENGIPRRFTLVEDIEPDQRITTADLDDDGSLDRIIADHQDDMIRVYRGGGMSTINIHINDLDRDDAFAAGPYGGNGTDRVVVIHPEHEGLLQVVYLKYDNDLDSWVGKASGDFLTEARSSCAAVVGNFEAGGALDEIALIRTGISRNVDLLDFEEATSRFRALVDPLMDERDLLVYSDHGYEEGWAGLYDFRDVPGWGMNSWNHRPVIYSSACSTGDYGSTDNSMALTCLKNGAGLFIGATGGSQISENNLAMNLLTDYASGYSAGISLRNHKQRLMRSDFDLDNRLARKWTLEYQIFGDPAFGVSPGASPSSRGNEFVTRASSSLEIRVPQPVFIGNDGMTDAMIPGGSWYSIEGFPLIPYYTAELEIPHGLTVSSMLLTREDNWTYFEDLDLRPFPGYERAPELITRNGVLDEVDPDDEWYPINEMSWRVRDDPVGNRSLLVNFFPFQCNIEAGIARFAANWTVEFETSEVKIDLTRLSGPIRPVDIGESASFSLTLSPSGEGCIVSVAQWIEDSSGELVDELGTALIDVNVSTDLADEWDPLGSDPGSYVYFVEVKNGEGVLIETGRIPFMIGVPSIDITEFTVEPRNFTDGIVNVGVKFRNDGDVQVEGNATISLLSLDRETVRSVEANVTLTPGGNIPLITSLDMSSLPENVYVIRARFQSNLVTISDTLNITRSGYRPPEKSVFHLSIDHQVSHENITKEERFWINGTVSRNDGLKIVGIGIGAVIGNGSIRVSGETGDNGTFSLEFEPLEVGSYNITLQAMAGELRAFEMFTIVVDESIPGGDDDDDDVVVDDDDIVDDDVVDDDIVDDDVIDDDVVDDDVVDDDVTPDDDDDNKKTNWGLIAGIIIGSIFLITILVFFIMMVRRSGEEVMDWGEE